MSIAVLFVTKDSVYKSIPECDCYDIDRNARTFAGNQVLIAHPPCRLFGKMSHSSKFNQSEYSLAFFAVDQVRRFGGIVEHPEGSKLWPALCLPRPATGLDFWRGQTIQVDQYNFGHLARKRTWLYIVGLSFTPTSPIRTGKPKYALGVHLRDKHKYLDLPARYREGTPIDFALWLVALANQIRPIQYQSNTNQIPIQDQLNTNLSPV
jgi:hypothetical protein